MVQIAILSLRLRRARVVVERFCRLRTHEREPPCAEEEEDAYRMGGQVVEWDGRESNQGQVKRYIRSCMQGH